MLKLYNTLTKQVDDFTPIDTNQIKLYTCGPTVYNYAHIGNFRSYLFADSVYRALKFLGGNVKWVMNLTDVDDKTIKGTLQKYGENATAKDLRTFTDTYIEIFLQELTQLNIDPKNIEIIRVSDVIPQIQDFILTLLEKGYAYKTPDGVYFSIEKYQKDFGDYGTLVGKDFLEGKKVGARVAVDEYEKENLSDFALWKAHSETDGQIFWEHETLGKGRPGWHIECSVINQVAFGNSTTDIHTGGVDLVFPHHTNEIAQSQPLYTPFTRLWAHCEHLQIDGKKMAKRDGNVYTLKDLTEKNPAYTTAYRYLCLQTDFRKQMNFTWESLEAAKNALEKLQNKTTNYKSLPPTNEAKKVNNEDQNMDSGYPPIADLGMTEKESKFIESISNDLNFSQALAVLWEVINDNELTHTDKYKLIQNFDQVLGLGLNHTDASPIEIPEEVQKLAQMRDEARQNKDFEVSDNLRRQILALGYEIVDLANGSQIHKKD